MTDFSARRKRLRALISTAKADALLVTNFKNVTYLTGFKGDDSYLLVTPGGELLITDRRYTQQLEEECPKLKLEIRPPGQSLLPTVKGVLEKAKIKRLGIEGQSITVSLHQALAKELPKQEFVVTEGLVEELRTIKDKDEIEATRLACVQARRAFDAVRAMLTPETTELEIAAELEYRARRIGAKCLAFPPLVGVGWRSALPHVAPTDRKLKESDFVLIDWGVNSGLYLSDLTRVLVTGKISPKLRKVYGVVLKAQLAAIDAIRPGVSCEDIDNVARSIIAKAGYGEAFAHGLGHGTGLDIHEQPRFAAGQKTKLQPGMIVTVEPGIYLPDWGGVRIEDDVLVTRSGHEVLTDVPKELDDCVVY